MNKKKKFSNLEINNRKAKFDYEFIEKFIARIALQGTEIKSIREGKASLVDSYCYVSEQDELWLYNSYIAKYENGGYINHEERRERKLLLNKKEIKHLKAEVQNPQMTIVPIKMFINNSGLCKVLITLAKGKKQYYIRTHSNHQNRFKCQFEDVQNDLMCLKYD